MLSTILLVFAFVFAIFATGNAPSHPRFNWGWAALAFYFASLLFGSLARF